MDRNYEIDSLKPWKKLKEFERNVFVKNFVFVVIQKLKNVLIDSKIEISSRVFAIFVIQSLSHFSKFKNSCEC